MWSFVDTPAAQVSSVMMLSCVLSGLSHILRPRVQVDHFVALHAQGRRAMETGTFVGGGMCSSASASFRVSHSSESPDRYRRAGVRRGLISERNRDRRVLRPDRDTQGLENEP